MRLILCPLLLLAMALGGCGEDKVAPPPGEPRYDFVEVPDEGQASVWADLDLALGEVATGRAEDGALFQAEMTLPADGLSPEFRSETIGAESGPQARVSLGLSGEVARLSDLRGDLVWRLYFSPDHPLDLDLDLGAASADLDLSGIPTRRLSLNAGVAQTRLAFDAPNPESLRRLDIEAGVGEVALEGLGHARFERLRFQGGVGKYRLDFSGDALVPGAEATVEIGVGSLDVRVPADTPLRLDVPTSRIAKVDLPAGLVTLGSGRYATPGAEDDPDALRLRIRSGPGRTQIRFAD